MTKFLDGVLIFAALFVIFVKFDSLKLQICKTFGLTNFCYSYYRKQCSAGGKIDVCKYAVELYANKKQYYATMLSGFGCNSLGDGSMCFKTGYFTYRSYYTYRDDKNNYRMAQSSKDFAIKSWEKSCELKYSDGCFVLGRLYEYGEGVRQNLYKAEELYNKACKLYNKENADMLSCNNYYKKKLAEFKFLP